MGLDQRERERERGGAAHEIARLAEGTLVSYLYRSGKLWSSARSNQISRSDVLDVVDCTNVLTSTELHCAETEKCPILKLSWWTQWNIVLTRQYEERGTLLAKSKVGRNPENPRFSWLLFGTGLGLCGCVRTESNSTSPLPPGDGLIEEQL